jgi:hypothetical protein
VRINQVTRIQAAPNPSTTPVISNSDVSSIVSFQDLAIVSQEVKKENRISSGS